VPEGATRAVAGFRVNTECRCSGVGDFVLKEVRFTQGGGANFIPNGDFAEELADWSFNGTDESGLRKEGKKAGWALRVKTEAGQPSMLNSARFSVRPGRPFTAVFRARIAPDSVGSGFFMVAFLNPREIGRRTLPFRP
jgi:hypothetical protein